jgi:hypothetical protein
MHQQIEPGDRDDETPGDGELSNPLCEICDDPVEDVYSRTCHRCRRVHQSILLRRRNPTYRSSEGSYWAPCRWSHWVNAPKDDDLDVVGWRDNVTRAMEEDR